MQLILAVLFATALSGCETMSKDYQQSSVNDRLIGIWEGEYTEKDGAIKSWAQTRKADGTYSIDFIFTEPDGAVSRFTETGQWWIKDGLFHEIAPSWMKQPDSYQYRFNNDRCIEFLLVGSHVSIEDVGVYRFVECLSDEVPSV